MLNLIINNDNLLRYLKDDKMVIEENVSYSYLAEKISAMCYSIKMIYSA